MLYSIMQNYIFMFSGAQAEGGDANVTVRGENHDSGRVKKLWKIGEWFMVVSALLFIIGLFVIPTVYYALPSKQADASNVRLD